MNIPGIAARHAIITPNCRTVPRPHFDPDPAMAAFDEAAARCREEYAAIMRARGPDGAYNARLVLMIENLPAPESEEGDDG